MKKRNNRSSKPGNNKIVILLAVLLAVIAVFLLGMIIHILKDDPQAELPEESTAAYQESTEPDVTATPPTTAETTYPLPPAKEEISFPYELENEGLVIESLFQYSGLNPDAGWMEGNNIGAVVLKNTTDKYVKSVSLTVILSDDTQLRFQIFDIPADREVWAFEINNAVYEDDVYVVEIQAETVFGDDELMKSDQLEITYNGIQITVVNHSGKNLSDVQVMCHAIYNGVYFGGTAYMYPVASFADGESASVNAVDCFLGEVEVSNVVCELTQ